MKHNYIAAALVGVVFSTHLAAGVTAPEVLTKNDFETSEYQLFVTKTRSVELSGLTPKVVFEGDADNYYTEYQKVLEKKLDLSEQANAAITHKGTGIASSAYYKEIRGLQNFGYAVVGSVVLNAMLGSFMGDRTYVQVTDYYKADEPVTRVVKYLVSDDSLDTEEMRLVFNTTDTTSYHFRSGGFSQPAHWNPSTVKEKK